jgi:hypothetical protein
VKLYSREICKSIFAITTTTTIITATSKRTQNNYKIEEARM